ncbi:FMN-dependent NADH-azoreductase 1 [Dinoroseobacter shibae DFL 12 = DSM 16493]|uniref:FMN dependent NADH:quinone oxidoreductase n=1 Tax=Dinoroseobacter shibae (strain DSM 16493 / NCIMB 14021 / DFL 12) TaxID=398580 RepID=A8LMC6_DINSH|nr:FMN-dependent NADH-azoreductase 1 [Dinoroseobacter shibae DFL 12 = DSM 16493]
MLNSWCTHRIPGAVFALPPTHRQDRSHDLRSPHRQLPPQHQLGLPPARRPHPRPARRGPGRLPRHHRRACGGGCRLDRRELQRTADQRAVLALSDSLVAELQAADTVLITLPIWNFGIPSTLKAWIDQVARAGVTFRYTPDGPVGLLEGKRAILAVASGGTEVGSAIDFATDYLRHVLGFIGIHEVEIVAADRLMVDADASHAKADAAIDALAA